MSRPPAAGRGRRSRTCNGPGRWIRRSRVSRRSQRGERRWNVESGASESIVDTRAGGRYGSAGVGSGWSRRYMSIQSWSDNTIVVELQDDPAFSDDLVAITEQLAHEKDVDVVLDFRGVSYVNSSNLAKLLKLRKTLVANQRRLVVCGVNTSVWGIFLVTGLEKVFEFADNLPLALAGLQIDRGQ
ncbi:MAG: anti-sigma factor antagonist [Phycisphaerales bacterium]|nr:MAG: anti-sigma factor antagonist [Phycisphaerales bacterium]